jgi:hypothetical protein
VPAKLFNETGQVRTQSASYARRAENLPQPQTRRSELQPLTENFEAETTYRAN